MKKSFCLILALLMAAAAVLAACEKKEEEVGADTDTKAALAAIMEAAKAAAGEGAFIPMTLDYEATRENGADWLGLAPEQFDQYAMDSFVHVAAIGTQAFEVALVKCKDYAAAKEVKKIIAEKYNSMRWVCTTPEQCFVVESGRFVMLGAVYNAVADAFQGAFADQFKETKAGEANKFYKKNKNHTPTKKVFLILKKK
jgi:hypothetical protein